MMLRIKDRAEREFCYAPTAEEVITDIARKELRSYRQLPVNFYQIQTKFRDEIRPRFGVLRAREFSMKDAYSFDADEAGMLESYRKMFDAYVRIFTRLGLTFRPVAADSGEIGGSASHEFQVLADSGEDQIAYSDGSDYAANIEKAEALAPAAPRAAPTEPMRKNPTPGTSTCEGVARLWNEPLSRTVKAILLYANHRVHMLLIRGDHSLNEIKTGKLHGLKGWRWASDEEILAAADGPAGYLGPVGLDRSKITVVADRTVAAMSDFICGANEKDFHIRGVNWGRDCPEPDLVADIRNVVPGDPSPDGKGTLAIVRGIEVGHVFALGRRYSEAMGATFTAEDGTREALRDGLLRHRRHPHRGRGHRAEPRRQGDHLARPDGALHGGGDPAGHAQERGREGRGREALRGARRRRRRGAARRPRRAPGRDARRPGAHRASRTAS